MDISTKELKIEEKPFASGGFGKVYKAKWHKVNVVVKVFDTKDEGEQQAVRDEASITRRLKHPNVIELFGITCLKKKKPQKMGIVMELAEHSSLDTWIGKIDPGLLTKIALGIVDGLTYVHSQHVIHRDIKPKNILMFGPRDDMIPKIADFGVSKVIETVMKTRTRVGHELYMAPEVRVFGQYNYPADIYSLAMMLFEMFNKNLIAQSSDEVKRFIWDVYGGKIGELPQSCNVPIYLENVTKRGWNQNPEQRPALSEYRSTIQGKYSCLFIRSTY